MDEAGQGALVSDSARADVAGLDTNVFTITDTTITLRQSEFPRPEGKVVNILITGVDSRLGDNGAHADANHLVRFFVDSAMVEIISIPRDTYADAGFDDTTDLNKLANVRAVKGRHAYMSAVSEITGVYPIHHYVEFGFSQAIGLLEVLGYKDNATSTLRVLRSRQAYRAGDFQRSYNQGRFIRSAILKNLKSGTDFVPSLGLRAGVLIVDTDLTYDASSTLVDEMNAHGFDASPSRVWVRLMPAVVMRMQAFEFDSTNIVALNHQIDERVGKLLKDSLRVTTNSYEQSLQTLLNRADSCTKSAGVVRILRRPYDQRAWMQVTNRPRRAAYRDRLCGRLEGAYRRMGHTNQAYKIHEYVEQEKQLLEAGHQ